MKLPNSLTITEVTQAFRDRDTVLAPYYSTTPDLRGNRIMNVGAGTENDDVATYTANGFCTQGWERAFIK